LPWDFLVLIRVISCIAFLPAKEVVHENRTNYHENQNRRLFTPHQWITETLLYFYDRFPLRLLFSSVMKSRAKQLQFAALWHALSRLTLLSIMASLSAVVIHAAPQAQTVINFDSPNFELAERVGSVLITVVRSGDLSATSSIEFTTDDTGSPVDCSVFNGLASSRCDFNTTLGTLIFAPGETEKTFRVMVNQDSHLEPLFETFKIKLFNPGNGVTLGNPATAVVKIDDINNGSPEAQQNLIDRTSVFVRQQYHDFLNRDPDAEGLAFWIDNIDKCDEAERRPPDQTVAQCKALMRASTSAAFFLSIEFRQTGGLVSAFYAAALDRPRSLPGYLEFLSDTETVGRGVVVGQDDWQSVLTRNRETFMNDFVTRAEFVALYPTADTPAAYANKLYLHALGRLPIQTELNKAIADFGNGLSSANTPARAQVLLRVISAPDFNQVNSAFVYMQYVGYLRRNPNELPDLDFAGYDFWLQKLNQFNGNFVEAEMVKAFVESAEYRSRFGQP
jgi:hypothetical protein